jgi:hypothetical protein
MKTTPLIPAVVSLTIAATFLDLPSSADDKDAAHVPYAKDSEGDRQTRWKDLRGVRSMEFFLIGSEPVDGQIKGACYNTTGLNTSGDSRIGNDLDDVYDVTGKGYSNNKP